MKAAGSSLWDRLANSFIHETNLGSRTHMALEGLHRVHILAKGYVTVKNGSFIFKAGVTIELLLSIIEHLGLEIIEHLGLEM